MIKMLVWIYFNIYYESHFGDLEILSNIFVKYILAHKNNTYKGIELPQEVIKGMLYKKADDIIETEFYAEYRNVITKFRRHNESI